MSDFRPAQPHGPLTEVFPDVFVVCGSFRVAPGIGITRNMIVLRQGGELVLVNAVRLTPEGEAELERLGRVTHLVRIGAFHDADDPYVVDRFRPTFWALPGTKHKGTLRADRDLAAGTDGPVSDATVFVFERGKQPEAAILVGREGGILVTADSYQNWSSFDGCSALGKVMMRVMGFGPMHIGGPWVNALGRDVRADFDRLREMPFRHLVPGHGTPLRDTAKEGLATAMKKRFPE